MRLIVLRAVMAATLSISCSAAQTFEAASVKASPEPPVSRAYTMSDTRVELGSLTLKYLIQLAYQVEAYQVTGPEWIGTTRFDIAAKLPAGSGKERIPAMLQALLADRMKLILRREPKEQDVYALLIGKGGVKLKEAAPNNQLDESFLNGRTILQKTTTAAGDGVWTVSVGRSDPSGTRVFDAPRIAMADLARTLTPYVERPVMDMTGLTGFYHVTLEVPRGSVPGRGGATADSVGEVSVLTSVQKLGLMLERRKAPVDLLVVESAGKVPTEN